jgi:DNA-directed RNA polymerase specialized sigma24 family protein
VLAVPGPGKRISVLARCQGVGPTQAGFAEFYASSRDDCLRTVLAVTGDRQAAEDCIAEAHARAWASWPAVGGAGCADGGGVMEGDAG